jgi:hypothetical protein|tara:strand:- start:2457 stop:2741 length:285 start_codon:yes stop_codon:yes gene_type:complete
LRKVSGTNEKVSKSGKGPKQPITSSKKKVALSMTKPSLHDVDKKVSVLTEIVERIETNHLEHIKKDIDKLDFRIWAILFAITVQLAVTVTSFLF